MCCVDLKHIIFDNKMICKSLHMIHIDAWCQVTSSDKKLLKARKY